MSDDNQVPSSMASKLPEMRFKQSQITEIFNNVQALLDRYDKCHSTLSLGDLLNMEDKLAIYYCNLGEIAATFNRDYTKAYYNRLIMRASKVQRKIMEQGMKITAAKEVVDGEIANERWAEMETHYMAERVDNLRAGCRVILDVMSRRIIHLRDEVKNQQFHSGQRT